MNQRPPGPDPGRKENRNSRDGCARVRRGCFFVRLTGGPRQKIVIKLPKNTRCYLLKLYKIKRKRAKKETKNTQKRLKLPGFSRAKSKITYNPPPICTERRRKNFGYLVETQESEKNKKEQGKNRPNFKNLRQEINGEKTREILQ